MKLKYIVVYENSSDEFDIEQHRIKIKVTVGLQNFPIYHNTNCQVLYLPLVQAKKLILSMSVHLIVIYKIYEYRHA